MELKHAPNTLVQQMRKINQSNRKVTGTGDHVVVKKRNFTYKHQTDKRVNKETNKSAIDVKKSKRIAKLEKMFKKDEESVNTIIKAMNYKPSEPLKKYTTEGNLNRVGVRTDAIIRPRQETVYNVKKGKGAAKKINRGEFLAKGNDVLARGLLKNTQRGKQSIIDIDLIKLNGVLNDFTEQCDNVKLTNKKPLNRTIINANQVGRDRNFDGKVKEAKDSTEVKPKCKLTKRKKSSKFKRVLSPEHKKGQPIADARLSPYTTNLHSKPYYDAWVNRTAVAASKNPEQDRILYERQMLRKFQEAIKNGSYRPPRMLAHFNDESLVGKIKIKR